MNNAPAPLGLPGRGAGDAQFQNMMGRGFTLVHYSAKLKHFWRYIGRFQY
jgi:hypothetical protein